MHHLISLHGLAINLSLLQTPFHLLGLTVHQAHELAWTPRRDTRKLRNSSKGQRLRDHNLARDRSGFEGGERQLRVMPGKHGEQGDYEARRFELLPSPQMFLEFWSSSTSRYREGKTLQMEIPLTNVSYKRATAIWFLEPFHVYFSENNQLKTICQIL